MSFTVIILKLTACLILAVCAEGQAAPVQNCSHFKVDSGKVTRCTICAPSLQLNLNYTRCLPCTSLPYCTRCDAHTNGTLFCQDCLDGYRPLPQGCKSIGGCADPQCSSCSTPSLCLSCNVGYYLTKNSSCSPCPFGNQQDQGNGTCSCPDGKFLSPNASQCLPCLYPCQNCNQSASSCTLCIYGYFIGDRGCQLCLTPNCIICRDGNTCLNCTLGYLLVGGVCQIQLQLQNIDNYINLPEFYYFCMEGCFYCYKYDFCVTCLQGYSRDLYSDACLPCSTGCLRCEALLQMQCFACGQGFLLQNGSCIQCRDSNCLTCTHQGQSCSTCKEGFTAVNGSCLPCAKNCKKCDRGGQGTCEEGHCLSGHARVSPTTCATCALGCYSCSPVDISTCLSCPIGSFQVGGGQCQICPSACVACADNQNCSSCRQGHRLVGALCYPDCSYPCLDCSPFNPRICSRCFDGYLLGEDLTCQPDVACNLDGNCTICPVAYFLDPYQGLCLNCTLQDHCIKCETEASKCAICSSGFYLIENACLPCSSSCLTCQLETYCFTCKPGFFLLKEESSQVYGQCLSCAENCLSCVDEADKCSSCDYSQQLIGFACVTNQNILFQLTLQDPALPSPNAEQYALIKQIVAFTNAIAAAFGPPYAEHPQLLFLKDISAGSVQVTYMATVAELDPRVLLPTIETALAGMASFGSFKVISTQIVTNGFQADVVMQPDPSYFYLALAPAPLFLGFLAFVVLRFWRKEGKEERGQTEGEVQGLEVHLEPMETGKSLKGEEDGAITL